MTKKTIALAALLAGGIAAILLLAGSVRSTPEEIIKEMNVNMAGLQTVRSETTISIEITEPEMNIFSMSLSANSDTDKTDPENIKSAGDFDIDLGGEGMLFTLTGKAIAIGDTSYIKMTTIPALPMIEPVLQMMGLSASDFKKKWIKIDEESTKNMFGNTWTSEMETEMETNKELEKQITDEIQNLFLTSNFYAVKQELPEEKINGETAHHYLVSLQKEETKNLFLEMFRIMEESQNESFSLSGEELIEFSQEFGEFFDKIGGMEAHLWIGKYDRYLYKFQLDKTIDAGSLQEGEEGKIVINMIMEFSNFDQPLNITAPEDFKSLDELFGDPSGGLFGPMMGSQQIAQDGRVMANMNQMRSEAQIIELENDSYNEVSCTGDFDIEMLCDDIENYSINQEKPTIHQSRNAYCAYIEISDGYYCIDSTLRARETTTYPGQYGYCNGITFTCPIR